MSDQAPLPLYEVLEEEYVSLHGPLPDDHYNKPPDARLKAIYELIHTLPVKRSALCISGGGIRSATFALGVIQGLARCGLLDKFDYLSTVSGGGYIGGWLSAWIHRNPEWQEGVSGKSQISSPLEPEAPPVRHLRSYSNYLSPRLGLLSADTWALVATITRNLILNWLVLIPLLIAVLLVPRVAVTVIRWQPSEELLWCALAFGFLFAVMGTVYMGLYRPSLKKYRSEGLQDREGQGSFLVLCLLPLVIAAISLTTFWAWFHHPAVKRANLLPQFRAGGAMPFLIFAVALYFVAWLIYSAWLRNFNFRELAVVLVVGIVGGALLYLTATQLFPQVITDDPMGFLTAEYYVCFAMPLALALFFLATVFFIGVGSRFTDDDDREWAARFGAWALIVIFGWSAISYIVVFGPHWLLYLESKIPGLLTSLGGVSGVITILLGRSPDTQASESEKPKSEKKPDKAPINKSAVKSIALALAAPVFAIFIIVALSLCSNGLILLAGNLLTAISGKLGLGFQAMPLNVDIGDHLAIVHGASFAAVVTVMIVMAAFGAVMGWFINVNKFSLHAMYRNRLIRAYLGASNRNRKANRFTGFDPKDNAQMHELRPQLFHKSSFKNTRGLAVKLNDDQNKVSRYLMSKLSDEAKQQLEKHNPDDPESPLDIFINEMNELLDKESLYDEERFAAITLNAETLALLAQSPKGNNLTTLNRLLLEQAFAGEINDFRLYGPLHVVNTALNLVKGSKLAWQQRKAESFTVSPLHSGSHTVVEKQGSYRRSKEYGNALRYDGVYGISLGTAVAISGAAVSPNMGYHSSSVVAFLLTLFNARLGWWLGNPGNPGKAVYQRPAPFFAVGPMIAEAFGLTDDKKRYVYLSDGGHFENLAFYEMVLRRSNLIVVSDASQDPERSLSDLGGAIRKIRIDFGIPIDFHDGFKIYPRSDDKAQNAEGKYCAIGTIHYSCVDKDAQGRPVADGTLIYIKPAVYGHEPADVLGYARESEMFPHETTGDQFFSESQFESYRALGSHVLDSVCGEGGGRISLDEFLKKIYLYLGEPVPKELEDRIQNAGGNAQPPLPIDETGS